MEAAVDLFAVRPFDDVQVSEIAKRAGVAHGLMFHHFGNKRSIYIEAVQETSNRLFFFEIPDEMLSPRQQIRYIIRAHFERMAENRELLTGHMRGTNFTASDPEAWAVMEGHRDRLAKWAATLLGYSADLLAMTTMVRCAALSMFHLSLKWLETGRPWEIDDQLVDAMIDVLAGHLRASACLDPTIDAERGIRLITTDPASTESP